MASFITIVVFYTHFRIYTLDNIFIRFFKIIFKDSSPLLSPPLPSFSFLKFLFSSRNIDEGMKQSDFIGLAGGLTKQQVQQRNRVIFDYFRYFLDVCRGKGIIKTDLNATPPPHHCAHMNYRVYKEIKNFWRFDEKVQFLVFSIKIVCVMGYLPLL